MRVLALVTDAYGGGGGIAQANRDLFEAMVKLDPNNNVVVYPRFGNAKNSANVPGGVIQQGACGNKILYSLNVLSLFPPRNYYDFIFCGHLFMAPLAQLLSWKLGVPYWIHIHGIEAWKKPGKAVARSVESARLITSVSRYTRREFLGWADIDPQKVCVLPNTVNQRFSPGNRSDELIARYGLQGKRILLTVGRISEKERYKGHDRVISALAPIAKIYPDLLYVIAGDGDDRPRLEKLSRDLQVEDRVKFIGPPSEQDLLDLYRSADVFVMPSTGEGFGIVFLEAAMSGLPVIGGSVDGSWDALREGRVGYSVNPLRPAELRAAIIEALESPKKPHIESAQFFCKSNYFNYLKRIIESRFFMRL